VGEGEGLSPILKVAAATVAFALCKAQRVGQLWFPLRNSGVPALGILGPHLLGHGGDSREALSVCGGWTDGCPLQETGTKPQETVL
jgi:hypothetical protein